MMRNKLLFMGSVLFLLQGISAQTVTLTWNPRPEPDVVGYRVYRSTIPGGGYVLLSDTEIQFPLFVDHLVKIGQTYYYVVTTVDIIGMESAFSQELMVTARNAGFSVSAGPDRDVYAGETVILSASTSPSGGEAVHFEWSQLSGPEIALAGSLNRELAFLSPLITTTTRLQFKVSATDSNGRSASDIIEVTVYPDR